jgi:formylglycine-generating enzyme required for sulfatase activity
MRLGVLAVSFAACVRTLPPHGETVVFVDTDAAVPQLVGHLRIEVLRSTDLTLIDKLDIARPDPGDWPASFSVSNESTAEKDVLVRLRAFPEGRLDDKGNPQAPVTIDRLVRVVIAPNVVSEVRVTLGGECFDTPADLAKRRSCKSKSHALEAVETAQPNTNAKKTITGTFAVAPCTAPVRESVDGLFQEEACVPGGAFLFGNRDVLSIGDASGLPERVVAISPMRMDRYEVTVGRWRAAVAKGFVPPLGPHSNNNAVLTKDVGNGACTFTDAPAGREAFPLSCIPFPDARAFCMWSGGDLPSEAQWEYAAQASARPFKTAYPWGENFPDCDHAIYARTTAFDDCIIGRKPGPAAEDAATGDATELLGITNLGGNVAELLLDAHTSLSKGCWVKAALHDPVCEDDTLPKSLRGGHWGGGQISVRAGDRSIVGPPAAVLSDSNNSLSGFRCVRPGVERRGSCFSP